MIYDQLVFEAVTELTIIIPVKPQKVKLNVMLLGKLAGCRIWKDFFCNNSVINTMTSMWLIW